MRDPDPRSLVVNQPRMLWRALVLLGAGGLGAALSMVAVAPALSAMARVLGTGSKGIFLAQIVMSAPSLAMLFGAPLLGWAAERLGYRITLLSGTALFLLSGLAGATTSSFWLLSALRLTVGLAAAAMVTSAYALISYYLAGRSRDRMLGLMSAAVAVVGVGGGMLAGVLAANFGWTSVFLLYAFALPVLVLGYFVVTDHAGKRAALRPPAAAATHDAPPLFALAGLLAILFWMGLLSVDTSVQLPFLMAERGLRDPRLVSWVITLTSAALFAGALSFDWLMMKIGARGILALMFLLVGAGHITMGMAGSLVPMLVGAGSCGYAVALIKPIGANYIFRTVEASMQGRATGCLVSCVFLGAFINPFVLRPLNSTWGIGAGLVLLGATSLVGGALTLLPGACSQRPASGEKRAP